MLSSGKQVFLYFLDMPITPSSVNPEEYKRIQEFKEKYNDKGIYWIIKDENELRRLFLNHLAMYFLSMVSGEKFESEKRKSPILKIRDAELDEFNKAIVRYSQFFESKYMTEKREAIISEILRLNKEHLPQRGITLIQLPIISNQIISTQTDYADIPELWKNTISKFADENRIQIEAQFWNVGNLLKKETLLDSYKTISFEGEEVEKLRYEAIGKLSQQVQEYEACKTFFSSVDSKGYLKLVLTNIGDTFDEDIHVKLIIKKGCILEPQDIPVPDKSIITKLLKKNLLNDAFKIGKSDTIDSYSGYPEQLPHRILNPIDGVFELEQFDKNLEHIFCYEYFSRDDYNILKFHVNYLKHNMLMAFPSILIFGEVPESIEYEITSRYVSDIIKGKIEISYETAFIR